MAETKVQTKNKKVILLGTAQTMRDAPFQDSSFDIWAVGTAVTHGKQMVPRVDRIFELHTKDRWEMRIKLYNDRGCPVYMQEHDVDVPKSVKFPREDLLEKYALPSGQAYFTNSISWMIAKAIEENYEEIHLYGVHMSTISEYAYEMPSCEFFLGIAQGRGIKVFVPPAADMLKAKRLYGYENPSAFEQRVKYHKKDMQKQRGQVQSQHQELTAQLQQYNGAIEMLKLVESWLER